MVHGTNCPVSSSRQVTYALYLPALSARDKDSSYGILLYCTQLDIWDGHVALLLCYCLLQYKEIAYYINIARDSLHR